LPLNYKFLQSVPITTDVASSNSTQVRCIGYNIYVIKFVSDLRQVSGFLQVFRFFPPKKLTATTDITEILLKVDVKHHNPNPSCQLCNRLSFYTFLNAYRVFGLYISQKLIIAGILKLYCANITTIQILD
jgi:hypothetical protein